MTVKVCIASLEYPPEVGGVGESVHRIAHMMLKLGYEVHVAVFHSKQRKFTAGEPQRARIETADRDGVLVHRLYPPVRSSEPIMQDFLSEIYSQFKSLHQIYNYSLFHAFFINETGFITTLLAREQNVPVINSIRGSDLHKHIFNAKQHGQTVWILENSDWVTFVSSDLQTRGRILAPSIQQKSSAFWNSIAPIDFSKLSPPIVPGELRGTVIGSVGRFRDKKGIEYLMEACSKISADVDLTLLLIGDFADRERDYWQQEVKNSGLGDRLIITGLVSRETALAYLPIIDIFAIPSLHDGCPNAMLEAMLASKAIVGTKVDAIGDILENEVDALLVNPGSAAELAVALREFALKPELRQRLGLVARKKAIEHLNPAVEQANWQIVYQEVLEASKPIIPVANTISPKLALINSI
ncbi:MAG: glycosyltransferase family 4 protein [Microcoleus sp. CSU_2_2]|nr:glycosyltransferase family 4 protein [Microcoleus sp. CSU_2_2]